MTAPVNWADLMNNAKGQLEPIPDGEYDAKVISAEATRASTGKAMWKVKFEITSGPHAPRKVFNNFVLTDDNPMALAFFFRHMEAMGLGPDFFAALPANDPRSNDMIASALVNRPCRLVLGHRQWQGQNQQDVKGVLPPLGGGPVAPGVATGPAVPMPGGMPTPSASATPTPTPASPPAPAVAQSSVNPPTPGGPPPLPI